MTFAFIMYLLGLEVRYREGMIVDKNSFQAFLFGVRPNTLSAAVAPVLIGATLAALDLSAPDQTFSWMPYIYCLAFAIGMQASANLINDLYDYRKGTDTSERLGPVRICQMGWVDIPVMKKWIAIMLTLSCICGFPLVFYGGWWLIGVGIVCVIFAYLYTTKLSYMGMGDLLVVVFFGLMPVSFSYYVETGTIQTYVIILSLGVGLVVDTLLILNNYRDREIDKKTGKRTLAVLLGSKFTSLSYLICGILGPIFSLVIFFSEGYYWPTVCVLPYLFLHLFAYNKMMAIGEGKDLNKVLELTTTNIFIFGFLLSAGFLLQKILL